MMPKLIDAEYRGGYRAWLRFADGKEGEIDLEDELWGKVFEPLKDERAFAKLMVHPELHTLVWPNGADFAPEFLYEKLSQATGSRKPAPQRAAK
jgi:hypothetical protein